MDAQRVAQAWARLAPRIGARRSLCYAAAATITAAIASGVLAVDAGAWGSAQGPPAGPTTPPFIHCPAIGADSSCEYLIDVTSTDASVPPTVLRDPTQSVFDGSDDSTVAVQNDTSSPLTSIHVGVLESGDKLFEFDGDGLCSESIFPKPGECPLGLGPFGAANYLGPDTEAEIESPDAGTIRFPAPLQPGQYTYFSLEAAPTAPLAAGELNVLVSSTLTNLATSETGTSLSSPAPVAMSDQAKLTGQNAAEATGTVDYRLFADPGCTVPVESLGVKKLMAGGVAEPSDASSATLPTDATYYWLATYSGDSHNAPSSSVCGHETMTFGAPPELPRPTITTILSGAGHDGAKITVPPGTPVTDTAYIVSPHHEPITGRITYAAYASAQCDSKPVTGLGIGGATDGSGPSTEAVTLPEGTYYFEAFYSGNSELASASTPCGEEVLTVVAKSTSHKTTPPAPAAAKPSSNFKLLGLHVNLRNGRITVRAQFFTAGTATVRGTIGHRPRVSRAAKARLCKHVRKDKRHRCDPRAPSAYGSATLAVHGSGIVNIEVSPSRRVLEFLRAGVKLNVVLTTTFQNRAGGAPATHSQTAFVALTKPRRKH